MADCSLKAAHEEDFLMRFFRMILESRLLCRCVNPRSPGSASDLLHRRDGHGANEAHHNNTHGDGQLSSESFRTQRARKTNPRATSTAEYCGVRNPHVYVGVQERMNSDTAITIRARHRPICKNASLHFEVPAASRAIANAL